jgi:ABC-type uncharacterized transport system auxiliary subunit
MMRLMVILLLAWLLSACSLSLESKEPKSSIYYLEPEVSTYSDTQDAHIFVQSVVVAPGLDSKRIALRVRPNRQNYYAVGNWPELLSEYLNFQITKDLSFSRITNSVAVISRPNIRNYKLQIRVLDFQSEYDGNTDSIPDIVIRLEAALVRSRDQEVLVHQWYEQRSRVDENRMSLIVSEMDDAFESILETLIKDIHTAIKNDLNNNDGQT